MGWHRLTVLLALAGCGTAQECPLIGCVYELAVRLPAGVTAAQGCVEGVCSTEVRVNGTARVDAATGMVVAA